MGRQKKCKIKKGDQVEIIAGDEKGERGKVKSLNLEFWTCTVEKRNMVKRHTKPTQASPTGGIVDKEAPIHLSNVRLAGKK